jgi:molecular chaperone GrpE
VLRAILPVVDDLDRAVRSFEHSQNVQALSEGVALVHAKLTKTLENQGLKGFDSKGQTFDPEKHEAITSTPVEDQSLKGKIVDEIEKGYTLHEKVLRHAKVVIGG